ncbi:MAG: hypothetical protein ACO1OC_02080 [Tuberibacillus sp.]
MSLPVTARHVAELLNEWYLQMEQEKWEEGTRIREEVSRLLNRMENDQDVLLYYTLLDYQQKMRLSQHDASQNKVKNLLSYYFYMHKGMQAYNINAYDEAYHNYKNAEKYLEHIPDEFEKAEFYYKMSALYYHMCKTELSINMAKKALAIFEKDSNYEKRAAHCYISIALNFINLKRISQAEDLLAMAWATAVYNNDFETQGYICHNLGLLYKEKKDPGTSIKWLLESMKYSEPDCSTYYLLTEAAYLLNQTGNAKNWMASGIQQSKSLGNMEYIHRFRILEVRYGEYSNETKEKILVEALHFFSEEGSWLYVKENAPYLIDLYETTGRIDKAMEYKELAALADQKLVGFNGRS